MIVPTQERVDLALWQRLRALAESKRAIVVIGPGTPTKDELDRPLTEPAPRRLGRLRAASLDDLPGLAEDLSGLAGELPTAWTIEGSTDVRVRSFVDARGQVRVVFVANRAAQPVTATLRVDDSARELHDPLADEHAAVDGGRASVTVAARATRLFVVPAG